MAPGTGVFGHAQVIKDPAHVARELAHFLCHTPRPSSGFDHADGEAAQAGDVFGTMAGSDASAVLIKVPIENLVATVLDGPLAAVDLEHALRTGLVGRATGEAVGHFH